MTKSPRRGFSMPARGHDIKWMLPVGQPVYGGQATPAADRRGRAGRHRPGGPAAWRKRPCPRPCGAVRQPGAAHHLGGEAGTGGGGGAVAAGHPHGCRGRAWHLSLVRTLSSRRVFEIFETFPSHAARARHLAGRGGRMLLVRSPALPARAPSIVPLEVLLSKPSSSG